MEVTKKKVGILVVAILTALVILSLACPAMAITSSKTYTLNADFDEGTFVGLEHTTVQDQLQISKEATTFPFMWIANAGEDTLSKWDTKTNKELARYNTWFGLSAHHDAWSGASPSRTCVDAQGNCYVANRHFDGRPADVIKILLDGYIDRNQNGKLDTSYDANNDGTITPNEMLPMTDTNGNGKIDDNEIKDERVAWVASVGSNNGLGRALAIDGDGNIWLGLYNSQCYYKLSSVDGSILAGPISVSPNTPYGALVDKHGILWGSSLSYQLLKLDTKTNQVKVYPHSGYGNDYGIALGYDANGNTIVYLAEDSYGRTFIKFDSSSETFSNPASLRFICTGIASDPKGNIVASNYNTGGVTKFAPDGSIIWSAQPQVNSEARGTVVDSNGDVWVIHRAASKLSKFSGSDGSPLGVFNSGYEPYTYTDATGLALRSSISPLGTWTVDFDSGTDNIPWGIVSWNSNEPTGTSVKVEVRSSNDKTTWSTWETVANGVSMSSTPPGRHLQIKTTMRISSGDVSPVLYDLTVKVGNQQPVANAGADLTVSEGDHVPFSGSFEDPDDSGAHTFEWDFGDGNTASGTSTPSHTYADNGVYTVTLKVTDDYGEIGTDTLTVTVNNVDPVVDKINSPVDPIKFGTPVTVDCAFTDAGILDTHTAVWDWGDGTVPEQVTITESNGAGTVSGTHTYSSAGIYTVKLTVTDDDSGSGSSVSTEYIVIYNPEGGFVTGGGWISSPEGAYVKDLSLVGPANFGFVSKYQKGANVPSGVTEFNFRVADFNFHSDSYDWLVVAGPRAQYKGTGTINGEGQYGFILTAIDGQVNGGGGSDKFRIKIWDKATDAIVYDNMMNGKDTEDPTTAIQKGSITIHSGK